ncbi:EamA family transporter [Bacillus horti]|uniref:Drug/metabolite transporter (DMT)-like permease n=1 Tax=Caldalkalibacillus horti TaxID=77523 RepID=A0ABT9VXD0_9BACI|nr:DMT family transporter [Bacillus horti]MDQ0165529.1 drug/metabolite transporter (DMT)-like permease [Bacillus horti]
MQMKYSIIVLLGAISYGVLSTFVKLAYGAGFTVNEVVGGQFFFGWLMLLLAVGFFSRKRIRLKHVLQLMLVGTTTSFTAITYYSSLQYVPASVAIILLFQFTWMGVALEAILTRTWPSRIKVASVLLLIGGTLLASGLFSATVAALPLKGILFGLCAAVSFTLFILVSERVAVDVSPLSRSLAMISGAMVFTFIVFPPTFIFSGVILYGLWIYALPLAFFGMVIPTLFFAIGMPRIGTGLGTILGAAELPTVIVMSWLVLREQIGWLQYIGIMIILIGIVLPQLKKKSVLDTVDG